MSLHKDCGREIEWPRNPENPEKFLPPLEFVDRYYIIMEDGTSAYVNAYKRHDCDPEEITIWMDLKRRQAQAKGISVDEIDNREERLIKKEKDRKADIKEAKKKACRTCGAPIGEMCINLSKKRMGVKVHTKNPHPSRMEFSWDN